MSDEINSEGALSGIRVVDLSRVLGGPFCTQILGDHGADVIKVEPPMGDETRDWGPPFETDADGENIASSYFHGANRNKRCIALDLSSAQGREVVFRLLESADVLVENFKVGTLEKWGMGYDEVLSQKFPKLIHCRITGFGSDGPLGGYPGYDAVIQAMCGLSSVNGTAEISPIRMGVPIVDLATGLNAAIGINMALVERQRSGCGQLVEATLYDSGVSMVYPHAANWLMSGKLPALTGNQHPNVVPYDMFSTRTKPIFIGVGNNRQFKNMLEVLGRPDLADDPRFRNNGDRSTNREALTVELTSLTRDWQCDELSDKLLTAGIPAGPVNNLGEVLDHDHTQHRGMVVEKDGYRGVGPPVKLSRTAAQVRFRPGAFAADNREVLLEAGYTEVEIEELKSAGAVVSERRR